MNIEENITLVQKLLSINGELIIDKLKGKEDKEKFEEEKRIAKQLHEKGIVNFDFTSDEAFEESLNNFLEIVK